MCVCVFHLYHVAKSEMKVCVCVYKVSLTQGVIAEGLLTCLVSVSFTSSAALFFLYQGFVESSISE